MKVGTRTRKWRYLLIAACVSAIVWAAINPPGLFGLSGFGFTAYGCRPFIISDVQVRADGASRTCQKTHDLQLEDIRWLLQPQPEILIIGTGWNGIVEVAEAVRELPGIDVRILKSGQAKELYNRLKRAGKKVAIHYHSTC
jgi:hypothetical protein